MPAAAKKKSRIPGSYDLFREIRCIRAGRIESIMPLNESSGVMSTVDQIGEQCAKTPGEYYSLEVVIALVCVLGGNDCVFDLVNFIDANTLYRERQSANENDFASGQISSFGPVSSLTGGVISGSPDVVSGSPSRMRFDLIHT